MTFFFFVDDDVVAVVIFFFNLIWLFLPWLFFYF